MKELLLKDPTMIRAMTQIIEEALLPRLSQCSSSNMMLEIHEWCREMDLLANQVEEHFLAGCSALASKE